MEYELGYGKEEETYCSCRKCGQMLTANAKFCPICGTAVTNQITDSAGSVGGGRTPAGVTKKEYRKKYAPAALYKELKMLSIVAYVLVGINVAVGLLANVGALLDAVLLLGLVLGAHKGRSKGCAVAILVYSVIGMVMGLVTTGTLTGWGWLAIGIGMLSTFRKMDKQYAQDVTGGIV